jgi:hypothetical protein
MRFRSYLPAVKGPLVSCGPRLNARELNDGENTGKQRFKKGLVHERVLSEHSEL